MNVLCFRQARTLTNILRFITLIKYSPNRYAASHFEDPGLYPGQFVWNGAQWWQRGRLYQIDAKLLYFIIRLLQSSTCFEQRCAHHQEVKLY